MFSIGVNKACARPSPGDFRRGRAGNVGALTALLLGVILGSMALSFDLGRAYSLQTEMQSAADAAALSAGGQLDNAAGARDRACLAAVGTTANCGLDVDMTLVPSVAVVKNTETFATDNLGADVATFRVKFFKTLTKDGGGNLNDPATTDAEAEFVEVVARPRNVKFWIAGVVGAFNDVPVQGRAVAGLGTAYCQVPPMFVCQPPGGFSAADVGKGIWAKAKGGSAAWGPGNFGMLALPGHTLSANEISSALAKVNPDAACYGPTGQETKPGQMTQQVANGINTRFDIYDGYDRYDPEYQPGQVTVKGLKVGTNVSATNRCKYTSNDNGWHVPDVGDRWLGPNDPDAEVMPLPRDSCAYSVANGGTAACRPAGADAATYGDGIWDIAHYMAINHSGFVGDPVTVIDGDPTYGNGNGFVSRWEVYKWEKANPETNLLEIGQAVGGAATRCYKDGAGPVPDTGVVPATDRRLLCVAAIDCSALPPTGNASVTISQWIGFFLTEPAGYEWSNEAKDLQTIYGEVVGPTAECSGGPEAVVAHQTVQLFE